MRNFHEISNENRKTVKYGIEAISTIIFFRINRTSEYKIATSLHDFKLEIKNGIAINVFGLCQNFQQNIGFL